MYWENCSNKLYCMSSFQWIIWNCSQMFRITIRQLVWIRMIFKTFSNIHMWSKSLGSQYKSIHPPEVLAAKNWLVLLLRCLFMSEWAAFGQNKFQFVYQALFWSFGSCAPQSVYVMRILAKSFTLNKACFYNSAEMLGKQKDWLLLSLSTYWWYFLPFCVNNFPFSFCQKIFIFRVSVIIYFFWWNWIKHYDIRN